MLYCDNPIWKKTILRFLKDHDRLEFIKEKNVYVYNNNFDSFLGFIYSNTMSWFFDNKEEINFNIEFCIFCLEVFPQLNTQIQIVSKLSFLISLLPPGETKTKNTFLLQQFQKALTKKKDKIERKLRAHHYPNFKYKEDKFRKYACMHSR